MKLTRKILALLLTVSMMLSLALVGQAATFTDVPEGHERYEAITELAGRGIINGYGAENGTFVFKPDQAVTRAEMAKLLATMFSISSSSTGANPFIDVADDFWARDYIIAAKDMGIIDGYPDGTYLPDKQVTWQEAVKLIVCALNWGDAAVETYPNPEGDWAYCYRTMGQKLGLTQGAVMTYTDPAPRGIIAQLFYNALSIKKAVSDGKGGWTSDENSSVEEESDYKTMRNLKLICTPTTNLEADTLTIKDGYVRLENSDGETYDMSVNGNTSIYNLIGRHLDVSYEEKKKEYTIKSVKDLSKVTEIDLVKIKLVSDNSIEYFTDDNFHKTSKVDFSSMDVIYNERPLEDPTKFADLLNNAITLELENDKARNYFGDVTVAKSGNHAMITIKAYKSYYMSNAVSSVDSETEGYKVSLDDRKKPLVLHVKDDINNEIIKKSSLTDKGTVQTTVSIATKSIVTFAESYVTSDESDPDSIGNHYVEFFTTSAKKTGTVEEISSAKAPYKGKIKIGSTEFTVKNPYIWDQLGNSSIGASVTYMTDPSGEIVYIEGIANGNERFAFFSEYVSGDTTEQDSAKFKFYDPEAGETFQVVVSDPKDIKNILEPGKAAGALFWVRIKNNKIPSGNIIALDKEISPDYETEILKKSVADDTDKIESINIIEGNKAVKTSSGYKIGNTPITVTSANGKSFLNPNLNKSTVTYEKSTMNLSLEYKGASKAYEIKRKSGTKAIVLHDKYKGLLTTSPVCVINESTGQGKVNDIDTRKYSYYNFKTGALSTNDLVIDASVANKLDLQKGDIITYYSDSDTSGIHIDKPDAVYILLRASEVAENRGAELTDVLNSPAMNASNEAYHNGFKKYGISSQNDIPGIYFNYTLSIPLWYDYDINQLALARNTVVSNIYLPGDGALVDELKDIFDEGKSWNKTSILEAMADLTYKTVSSSIKLFVYDKDASDENRLINRTGASVDDIKATLSELQTLEANSITSANEILSASQECSLVYSYFTNASDGMSVLYIIK